MTDFLTKQQRSKRMAQIRGKDSAPELALRRALHKLGFRFKLHDKNLPGKPDLVLPKYKSVIFVHGCFWHGHEGCSVANTPKSNTYFWISKFQRNRERDKKNNDLLSLLGWKVIIVWECELNSAKKIQLTASKIAQSLFALHGIWLSLEG